MTHEELEQIVLEQGSRLKLLDDVIKSERLGQPKALAFRCSHSGLFYPADYTKNWGRVYGIGLGPEPVSECWDSRYVPELLPDLRTVQRADQLMFPVVASLAQVDLVSVPEGEYSEGRLVLAYDDEDCTERARIVMNKQIRNSPQLALMHEQFQGRRKAGR